MVFSRMLFSICLLSTSLCFVGIALLVRSIPAFVQLFSSCLRFLLKWSYHLYLRILLALNTILQAYTGRQTVELPARLWLSVLISFLLGCVVLKILHMRISWIALLIFALHGCAVAILWTDFFEPQGLHIGEKLR